MTPEFPPRQIRIRIPQPGWEETRLIPTDSRVRESLSGLRFSTLAFGSLPRYKKGVSYDAAADGLFLNNGSILQSFGKELRYSPVRAGSPVQPYVGLSAGVLGGYLRLPSSLGTSGLTVGPLLAGRVGFFIGRGAQLEWGYQLTGRLRGVNLSATSVRVAVRF